MQTNDKVQIILSQFIYSKNQNTTGESSLIRFEEHFSSICANVSAI